MTKLNQTKRDMGIYLHIPFCKEKCIYCDFPSYQGLEAYYDSYIEALEGEIRLLQVEEPWLRTLPIQTFYIGGGTPNVLSLKQWKKLLGILAKYFVYTPSMEWTVEMNPGLSEKQFALLQLWKEAGINRISLGIQTFNNKQLAFLHRGHTKQDVYHTVETLLKVGIKNISGDLIYGLPGQSLVDWQTQLGQIVELPLTHVSVYGLQLEEGTLLERMVKSGSIKLADEDTLDTMYDLMCSYLPSKGFERYEISNFARPGYESQHNSRYWQYKEYIGFGAGSHGFYKPSLNSSYMTSMENSGAEVMDEKDDSIKERMRKTVNFDSSYIRYGNHPYVVPYINKVRQGMLPQVETVAIDSKRFEEDFCFLALRMLREGLQEEAFYLATGKELSSVFGQTLDELLTKGLLFYQEGRYCLTPLGAKEGNYVFSQFIR